MCSLREDDLPECPARLQVVVGPGAEQSTILPWRRRSPARRCASLHGVQSAGAPERVWRLCGAGDDPAVV